MAVAAPRPMQLPPYTLQSYHPAYGDPHQMMGAGGAFAAQLPWMAPGAEAQAQMMAQMMAQPAGPPPQFQRPRPPAAMPRGAPLCPDIELPMQPVMDAAAEDGPVSVAFGLRPAEGEIRPQRPCPNTAQYLHRGAARRQEQEVGKPRQSVDICGWVMAHTNPGEAKDEKEHMHAHLDEFRLVFMCISGWALMLWRSQDEFEEGIHGQRRAPRALAWFDLRRAFDLCLEAGDVHSHIAPHRLTVMMNTGNFYFCVELPEDVPVWYEAIYRLIQDASWQNCRRRDVELHQRKRWPAACGIVDALWIRGAPVGERAMAILFHSYDIDYDCYLRVGELMVLLQELIAALVHDEGRAEGSDRNLAVFSAAHRVSEDELFDRAIRLTRRLCPYCDGKVRKDDFILQGAAAISEALSGLGLVADLGGQALTDAGAAYTGFSPF